MSRQAVVDTYRDLHAAQRAYQAGRQELSRDQAGADRLAGLRQAQAEAEQAHQAAVLEYEAEAG